MLRRLSLFIVVCVCLIITGSAAGPAYTQSYWFAVPELKMDVTVLPDASARIVYDITFENYGTDIYIVDIGLPHKDYDIDTMSAAINGVSLSDIRTSEYIDIGVEIHLHSQTIPSGETGTLHFEATMPDMVYQDTTDKELASMRITPTWFDSDMVQGRSYIGVAIHLPEGIEPDEALYHQEPFTTRALYQGHAVAVWEWREVPATQAHMVGISFPDRVMTRVVKMTLIDLAKQWLDDNPQIMALLGAISLGLLALLFFRFSGGTGCSIFVLLAGGMIVVFFLSPVLMLPALPILIALVIFNETRIRRKPLKYLPPVAQTEGGGIKRGLTAPESAVLLELPLSKVLTLVIFGLLEKEILQIVAQDPLMVGIREPFRTWGSSENRRSPTRRRGARRKAAHKEGTVVHRYEDDFLDQLERNPKKPVGEIDFTKAMERLIKATAGKMRAFDFSDTQDYYRRVIDRALEQAQRIGEIEAREQYLDKYLPWVMMNRSYPTVLTHRGGHYWPMWARPVSSGGRSAQRATVRSGPARGGRTSFGDVAGSFSGWAEATMGGMAAAILPGSMSIPAAKGGFVNLSGVDRVTGDIFKAIGKASSSGGGGGGGSSCACAGCACACACAGGGR